MASASLAGWRGKRHAAATARPPSSAAADASGAALDSLANRHGGVVVASAQSRTNVAQACSRAPSSRSRCRASASRRLPTAKPRTYVETLRKLPRRSRMAPALCVRSRRARRWRPAPARRAGATAGTAKTHFPPARMALQQEGVGVVVVDARIFRAVACDRGSAALDRRQRGLAAQDRGDSSGAPPPSGGGASPAGQRRGGGGEGRVVVPSGCGAPGAEGLRAGSNTSPPPCG